MMNLKSASSQSSGASRPHFAARILAVARPVALMAGALFVHLDPVLAADPNVSVTVKAIPESASFSRDFDLSTKTEALLTYSAYQGKVTNNSTNVLNNVRFHGEADFANGAHPVNGKATGATCSFDTATNALGRTVATVDCLFGKIAGKGGASPSFIVVFDTPKAPASTTPCPSPLTSTCDRIDLNWTVFYSEGSNDSGGAQHTDTTPGLTQTALGTATPTAVNTFVPPDATGKLFYTGLKQHATPEDPWVTLFQVPATAQATVEETDTHQSCLGILSCWFSTMSVTDLAGLKSYFPDCSVLSPENCLRVTLLRDASTINSGAKIGQAIVKYSPSAGAIPGDEIELKDCDATAVPPVVPAIDKPCILHRTPFPKKTTNPDDSYDWKFEILAIDNGRFAG